MPDQAENGEVAFEKYCQHPYDVVLMDIMMPVMNGLDATKSIRNFEKNNNQNPALVIAVSANFLKEDTEDFMSYGLDYILNKPLNFKALDAILKEYFVFE